MLKIDQKLFFGLLLVFLTKLGVSGYFLSFTSLSLLSLGLCGIWLYFGKETPFRNKLKLFFPPLSVPVVYNATGKIVSRLQLPKIDLLLQRADQWFFGESLSLKMCAWIHPLFTEIMYLVYLLFFYYILSSLIHYVKRNDHLTRSFYSGLFSIYWIGFIFYMITPGEGPHFSTPELFGPPLKEGILFSASIHKMLYEGMNGTGAFPSLHCSLSAFCLLFDWTHRRRRFYPGAIYCTLVWISTIYLRYHYFVDFLSGMALTLFALYLAKRSLDTDMKPLRRR
ncbi:MAG: phosphatase PAP2 family protein [Simkaniaceae bacterium]|nr:phosphatase PAP2 family protein [Candidatus Sacchlamyda saccharinae]